MTLSSPKNMLLLQWERRLGLLLWKVSVMSTLKTTQMHGVENHRVHFYESHIIQTKEVFFPVSLQLYFNSYIIILP